MPIPATRPSRGARRYVCTIFAVALAALAAPTWAAEPVPLIFDTDMDSDCDDAGALAIVHALADRGEVQILATPVSARHRWSGPCVDAINTYFGRPDLPIGIPRATPNRQGSRYAEQIAREFPHDFPSQGEVPDAVAVYRRVLAGQPDGSVVVVTVGDVTNVRDLLFSRADEFSPLSGAALARAKVKTWVCMGGRYPLHFDPTPFGNFKMDPQATVAAVEGWPAAIVFTGGGPFSNRFPAGARLKELPAKNPIRRVYELYFGGEARDRHCADPIAVMVAARGTGAPWRLVTAGYNQIFPNGTHQWRAVPDDPRQSYIAATLPGVDQTLLAEEMESLMMHLPAAKPESDLR